MSKARDELEKMDYDYMHTVFCDESVFHYNVMQLRNKYKEVLSELEAEKTELINSFALSLDEKRRKLYLSELKETLNKYLVR